METDNILSQSISSADDKSAYDAACKRLLANKIILAWIMKSCLEEFRYTSVDEIAAKYIEGSPQIAQIAVYPDEVNPSDSEQIRGSQNEDSTINEGTVTFDIRFHALAPGSRETIRLIINIEAQNNFYPGYPLIKRGIYYCSRMISSQYGVEFVKSHFEKIKKVYSIWICSSPPLYRQNTINRYCFQEEKLVGDVSESKENYDLLTAIIICLGPPNGQRYNGILKLLEVLLSSRRKVEEKKKILQEDFHIEMTYSLESEVWRMCNLSEGIERTAVAKGLEQGTLKAIRSIMASLNLTKEQAMSALRIPDNEKEKYLELLRQDDSIEM